MKKNSVLFIAIGKNEVIVRELKLTSIRVRPKGSTRAGLMKTPCRG